MPPTATLDDLLGLAAADPEAVRRACDAYLAEDGLAEFIRQAWHVVEPDTPLAWNWHIDAIALHLEAVSRGEIRRLLINVPPGHMKSLIVCVFWPAWVWVRRPGWRVLYASYSGDLALRDSLKCRDLVQSDWYRDSFRPAWSLRSDQKAKSYFENTARGFRMALGVGGATGYRGDCTVLDDPLSVREADSAQVRESTNRWIGRAWSNRLNDPRTGSQVCIMQRLHEEDPSGFLLGLGGYEHLGLPSEFDPARAAATAIGWRDPRTAPGELLFPELFGPEQLDEARKYLGLDGYAGQHQQAPFPAGGSLFPVARLAVVDVVPTTLVRRVRAWDKAGTAGGGDWTAGVLLGLGSDGRVYVLDVVRGRWGDVEREERIKQTAQLDGPGVTVWLEQEGGSGGKGSAQFTARNLLGVAQVHYETTTGTKVANARPLAAYVGAEQVHLLRGAWNREFVRELESFPHGKHDDQVDAAGLAFRKLVLTPASGAAAARPGGARRPRVPGFLPHG